MKHIIPGIHLKLYKANPESKNEGLNNYNNQNMVGAATSINAQDLEIITPMGTQEILERVPGINGFSDDGVGNSRINVGIRGINPRRS